MIPESVFKLELSSGALALFAVLQLHRNGKTGTAWPDRKTMSEMAGMNPKTLSGKLEELKSKGLIRLARKRPNNVCEYTVTSPDNTENGTVPAKSVIPKTEQPEYQKRNFGTAENGTGTSKITKESTIKSNEEGKSSLGNRMPSAEQKRLNACFRRRDSTEWSERELTAFAKVSRRANFAKELDQICQVYQASISKDEKDYRRRALLQLLNNWPGELDKCRNGGWRSYSTRSGNQPSTAESRFKTTSAGRQ